MPIGWEWDETLYQGSADHYLIGRPPYAPGLATYLAEVIPLDPDALVLDIGCGPGVIGNAIAPFAGQVIGVDPDPGMLAVAERHAKAAGHPNCTWKCLRAEDLEMPARSVQAAIFAQSFHWMDQALVAGLVREMLEPGGAFVHIADVKTPRTDLVDLPWPTPPYDAITNLVRAWLGPVPRAGQGELRYGSVSGEEEMLARAGFSLESRVALPNTEPLVRRTDQVISWVYSLSSSAPHLFGNDLPEFERQLRALLKEASPEGLFADQPLNTDVRIWRTPA